MKRSGIPSAMMITAFIASMALAAGMAPHLVASMAIIAFMGAAGAASAAFIACTAFMAFNAGAMMFTASSPPWPLPLEGPRSFLARQLPCSMAARARRTL
eukprot:5415409-Heterocapsa_arctica.AAC.1